jgi:hypothetical protein
MNPQSTKPKALSELKRIIGEKSEAFARFVGIPLDTIKSIESGRRQLSPENGIKIRQATGVDEKSLFGSTPTAYDPHGRGMPYQRHHLNDWRSKAHDLKAEREDAEKVIGQLAESIGNWTKVLLLAALEESKSTTYPALHLAIAEQVALLARRNRLENSLKRVLKNYSHIDSREMTGGQWRQYWKRSRAAQKACELYGLTPEKLRKIGEYHTHKGTAKLERRFMPQHLFL